MELGMVCMEGLVFVQTSEIEYLRSLLNSLLEFVGKEEFDDSLRWRYKVSSLFGSPVILLKQYGYSPLFHSVAYFHSSLEYFLK